MAAYLPHDAAREAPRGRPAVSLNHPQRTTRSWMANGVHYTVDSTTYSSPGFSFGAFSGTADGSFAFDPAVRSTRGFASRPTPFGLLGNAFGLLEDAFTMRPQTIIVDDGGLGQGARRRVQTDSSPDSFDTDLAYDEDHFGSNRKARPKSIFTRLKDRIVDANQIRRQRSLSSRDRSSDSEQARIPSRRASIRQTRNGTFPAATRTAPAAEAPRAQQRQHQHQPDFIEVDYHEDTATDPDSEPEYTHNRTRARAHRQSTMNDNMIEALENAVEAERRNVRACKQKLAQASRQGNVSSTHLQRILDAVKQHEATLATATSNLNEARARQVHSTRPPMPPRQTSAKTYREVHPQPEMPPRPSAAERSRSRPRHSQSSYSMRDRFVPPPEFDAFPEHAAHPDPIYQAFQNLHGVRPGEPDAFDHFFTHRFAADDANVRFFAVPGETFTETGRKRTSFNPGGPRPSFHNSTPYTSVPRRAPAAPKPPATVLTPSEAKRLFTLYDQKWKALPPSSPEIPYPARGLHAGGLAARDSIWAPHIGTHVGSWSEETVMQANAQAFYLGVVGLAPKYTQNPASGRVEVGFDKSLATPAQLQQLVELLKREKIRWHSDRLGRRNGGRPGTNEALQRDERARAVFHAVCELMDGVQ